MHGNGRIELPEQVRSTVISAIEQGDTLDWWYPRTENETLEEYINARKGSFEGIGFTVYPETTHADADVETFPSVILNNVEDAYRPVYREDYALRFEFSDESWTTVTDVWLELHRVIEEPA